MINESRYNFLHQIFHAICDQTEWKNEFTATIREDDFHWYNEATQHFTGEPLTITGKIPYKDSLGLNAQLYVVHCAGYRADERRV